MTDTQGVTRQLLYTMDAASTATGISKPQLYRYMAKGELKSRRIGKKRYIYHKELERFCRVDHSSPRG